ncbi:outer membrane protein [Gammaproteobacteria bacterium]
MKKRFWRLSVTNSAKMCIPFCMWLGGTMAVAGQVADLESIYQQALNSDSVLRSATAGRNIANEVGPQSRAALLPAIMLGADHALVQQRKTFPENYSISGWNLSLVQPLFRWDRWLSLKQADVKMTQAERRFQSATQGLLLRVTSAYFDLLAAEENVRFAAAETKAMARQLVVAKERLAVGAAILTEQHEAQSGLDFAQAQEIAVQNELENRREALREIIGTLPEPLAGLRDNITFPKPDPSDPEKWVASARDNNPNLQVARLQVQVAEADHKKAKAGHLPTVDFVLSHTYEDNRASASWLGVERETDVAMVQMKIPLFMGGQVTSAERQAVAGVEQARDDLDTADRQVVRGTRDAFRMVESSLAQIKAYGQALVSAKSMMDTTTEGREVGVRTMVDVLNAERDYFRAQRNLSSARHGYILSSFQLKSMDGSLSPADLAAVNQWLVR